MRSEYRGLLILLGVLLLAAVLLPMFGLGLMGPGRMGPGMMGGPGAWAGQSGGWSWTWGLGMGIGMLAMLAFWGALIVGVVLLVRWLLASAGRSGDQRGETALEVLKRRYASGEITREEFEQMRQVLER